ncbi:MAG: hypothetical protein HY749_16380 [Gammaproteobacteria bacterium]|nr:hypothetical protein [Gammaproteobacteria bacterium]
MSTEGLGFLVFYGGALVVLYALKIAVDCWWKGYSGPREWWRREISRERRRGSERR